MQLAVFSNPVAMAPPNVIRGMSQIGPSTKAQASLTNVDISAVDDCLKFENRNYSQGHR